MSWRIRRHADVEDDILDLAAWIARDSRDAAFRFLGVVEEAITSLAGFPSRGSLKSLQNPRLSQVRSLAVNGFPNHLILYEIRGTDVIVLAVVHGARHYAPLLRERER